MQPVQPEENMMVGKARVYSSDTQGSQNRQSPIMIALVVLLTLQVLMSGYQIINDSIMERQKEETRTQLIAEVSDYAATVDELTSQLLADYKTEVYNNPDVDTAAKQEVMGTEYNFMAIMLLIRQNTRLLEITAELNR
jgi:hypothetical protein